MAFLSYPVFGWVGLYYLYYNMPEIKGKALDEIPKLFTGGDGYQTLEMGGAGGTASAPSTPRGQPTWRGGIQLPRVEVVSQATDSPCPSPRNSTDDDSQRPCSLRKETAETVRL